MLYHEKYNHIINNFQDKFIDIAKFYYKSTGKALSFVPFYIAPKLKLVKFGQPIIFNPEEPIEKQRTIICEYLKTQITLIAESLPVHKVVPYENITSRKYATNKDAK